MSMLAIGGTVASTAISVGGAMLVNSMSSGSSGSSGSGKVPTYTATSTSEVEFTPVSSTSINNVNYDPTQGSADLLANYSNLAAFARQATAFRTAEREGIMPGSGKQMQLASTVLQDWMQGKVNNDVVSFTNRAVAERTGGGFNPWTGGGQSQDAFARSIGKLSSDFQQQGISSAPAWQQLANSFVVGVEQAASLALEYGNTRYNYDALNSNIDQFNASQELEANMFNSTGEMTADTVNLEQGNIIAENQYQSGMNSWLAYENSANQASARSAEMIGTLSNAASGVAGAYSGYRSKSK